MRVKTESPAAGGTAHGAGLDAIKSSGQEQRLNYHALSRRVQAEPSGRALNVYMGRERIGTILVTGGVHHAFGPHDEMLGRFARQDGAGRAIYNAHARAQSISLAT